MADIVKKVGRHVPPTMRTQRFDSNDGIAEGDILRIHDSLGHYASHLEIDAVDAFAFKLNVAHTIFPRWGQDVIGAELYLQGGYDFVESQPLVASGQEIIDTTVAEYQLGAGESITFDKDVPIQDLLVVIASGVFTITVS